MTTEGLGMTTEGPSMTTEGPGMTTEGMSGPMLDVNLPHMRLVRAASRATVWDQPARTSRAMTVRESTVQPASWRIDKGTPC